MNPATEHLEGKLIDYAYGELSEAEAKSVEAHLRACPQCADSLSAVKQVRRTMAQLPLASAPAAGLDSLMAYAQKAAEAARSRPARRAPWARWVAPVASIAALSVVLVISSKVARRPEATVASKQDEARGDWEGTPQLQAKQVDPSGDSEGPPQARAKQSERSSDWARPPEGWKKDGEARTVPEPAARPKQAERDSKQLERTPPARNDEGTRKAKVAFAPKAKPPAPTAYDSVARREAQREEVDGQAEDRLARQDGRATGAIASGMPRGNMGGVLGGSANAYSAAEKQPPGVASKRAGAEAKPAASASGARSSAPASSPAAEPPMDREQEVAQLRAALASGAQGQERARLLRRLCEALDAMNREREADSACDAIIREFPASEEAKSALERRTLRAAEPRR